MTGTWTKYLPTFLRARLEGRPALQKAIGNTGWLMADQVIRVVFGLLVSVWLARYLGPEPFGQLSYALAFAALFVPVALLGLESIVIRDLVRNRSEREELLGSSFTLMLCGALTVSCLATVAVCLIRPGDRVTHWLVGITVAATIFQSFNAIEFWFESQVESKYAVLAKSSAFMLGSGARILLIVVQAPLIAFAWVGFAEAAVVAAGLCIAYQALGFRMALWRPRLATAGRLVRQSWPLVFSTVVTMIYLRIDQVMLGEMIGSAEVGVYAAAVRLAEGWYFLATAICTSVFPSIVEAGTGDEELFYGQLQKLYRLMALISYAVAVPTMFLSGWVVQLLYGPGFGAAGPLLAVLIWAGLFMNLGAARTVYLLSMNWTRIYFLTMLLGCCANVLLNLVLIPRYGAMGAALASCISYWFAVHGICFLFKPLRRTGVMLTKAMLYPKVW